MFVEVIINGTPATLVFDTGAAGVTLDTSLVGAAKLRVTRPFTDRRNGLARADSLRVGGVLLRDEPIDVRPFAAVNEPGSGRPPVLGVIGTSFFRRWIARFDFAAGVLTLHDARTSTYDGSGIIVPVTFVEDKPVARIWLAREGGDSVEARLFVDAGSGRAAIALTPAFASRHGIAADGSRYLEVVGGRTLYGGGMDRLVRLPSARIGALRLTQPLVTVSPGLGAALARIGGDGTVGMSVLSRTTMILDYARSRIILEPAAGFDTPIAFPNVSGLQLQRRGGATFVRWVIPGSPADSAGVRADDEVVAIDEAPLSPDAPLPPPQLREAGTVRRVTIRRGGEARTVTLTLRPLI